MWAENNINLGDYFTPFFISNFIEDFCGKALLYDTLGITGGFGAWHPGQKITTIWGRGFICYDNNTFIADFQKKINVYAVRGKLSLERYRKWMNNDAIDIACGDPGILASSMHPIENAEKKHKIGFIPHWYDRYAYRDIFAKYQNIFHFIKIDGDADICKFWDDLNSCEIIFTSSLHGSVFAHAYGIPSYYICMEKDNKFTRDREHKFKDYYSNYDNIEMPRFNFANEIVPLIDYNMLYKVFLNLNHAKFTPSKLLIDNMKMRLLNAFPYKQHLKKKLLKI